jgi:hypothetical protein
MATVVPTEPWVGVKYSIDGGTTNGVALVPVFPETVTVIGPVEAPSGTLTTNCVVEAEATVACTPLKATVLAERVALKFVPTMVTVAPAMPLPGVNEVIPGVTVKLAVDVTEWLPTVTFTVPLVVPAATVTTTCVLSAD